MNKFLEFLLACWKTIKHWLKLIERWLKLAARFWLRTTLAALAVIVVVTAISAYFKHIYAFWDKDPLRGATTVASDTMGDKFTSVVYLDQGWKPEQSLWFYNTTQGSDLMPYDFFMVLEQVNSKALFRSSENMNGRYRYLPQRATFSDPDGLPVGFVKDRYKGRSYLGFTCAACHTSQVNYNGVGMRIDGGPAGSDMNGLIRDLAAALRHTQNDPLAHSRFVDAVLALGHYKTKQQVEADLNNYALSISAYWIINHTNPEYGFARLDAFGRIYNRVLEYLVNADVLKKALGTMVLKNELTEADYDKIINSKYVRGVLTGADRSHLLERFAAVLTIKQQLYLRNELMNPPDAPVSYPFLWDTPQHDYVQWDGLLSNGGLGPLGRNVGEVIGVFGTLDWHETTSFSLTALFTGQSMKKSVSFDSSIKVENLRELERQIETLTAPAWPQNILPKLDAARIERGARLYTRYCSACHAVITPTNPQRRVVAFMSQLDKVGTDPRMATNGATYQGASGILRNQYVGVGVGSVLLDEYAPVAALLTKATTNVIVTPEPGMSWLQRTYNWIYNLVESFLDNPIKASIKNGDYVPDTTAAPFASILAYKGRSLDGIWATAPYLHNGSVPSLYDLLLPKKGPNDPAGGEYRPDQFQVGSREFDPAKVGFKYAGYTGFTFDTTKPGNSNAGHDYGTRDVLAADGKTVTLPALTKDERMDLLEYLKSL